MAHTLIHNGAVIDGNGGPPISNGAVLVEDNRIVAVDRAGRIGQPDGATSIDARGGTIMPGLIDTHVHVMFEQIDILRMLNTPFSLRFYNAAKHLRATLEAGITSVRDAGGADLGVKTAVEQGLISGPRMQISTAVLSITGGHGDSWTVSGADPQLFPAYPGMPSGICDGPEGVRKKVREVLRAGADVVKICSTGGVLSPVDHPHYTQFSPEELAIMVQEAGYRGAYVMAHAQGTEGIKNAIRAGIRSIEHGMFLDDEAIDLMLKHGTFLVPTLVAPIGVIEQAEQKGTMPEYGLRKARETLEAHQESISRAIAAGVRTAMGTDAAVVPHGSNLRELGLMVRSGMTSMQAIVSSTKIAAECMRWDDRLGTLAAGKLADIVIVDGDPLADIRILERRERIVLVMKDGRVDVDRRE
ncbi:MAG TPA: amidohydrolase family protein [Roseiflexaceae bacterium]